MDDGVQAMLEQLNAGFPRVEEMTGPQAAPRSPNGACPSTILTT